MTATIFSFVTSMLWCNVYIACIAFMRQRNSFLIRFSIVPLALLIIAGILRLIFFVEFPYTVVLGSEFIFPAILNFFTARLFTAYGGIVTVHVYDVLLAAWIIGGLYNLQKYVCQSIRLNKSVGNLHGTQDIRIVSCMDKLLADSGKSTKVKIIKSGEISVPMITGFFKPVIYLPDIYFSDDELKNILLHEWTHFLHKDAWVKLSMYLVSSVFWWNPFVHLLKNELNHILEIQCDLSITSKMDEDDRINYLESISKVIRTAGGSNLRHTVPIGGTPLVGTNKSEKIEQRFHLVLDYGSGRKQRILSVFLLCTLIFLSFFASYMFVIQPRYFSVNEEIFDITPENSYLKINENGTYSLYSNGKYRCEITEIDVEPFSSLPVK